jgi:hypothetical protein
MSEQLDIFTAPPAPKPFDPDPPFLQGKFRLRHPMVPGHRWCAEEISTGRFMDCNKVLKILSATEAK